MPHLTISVTDLAHTLAKSPNATVIDVRTPHEFALVHAAPATNLPLTEATGVAKNFGMSLFLARAPWNKR